MSRNLPALQNVVLAIENHDRFHAAEIQAFLKSFDSPQVGICLDTANSLGAAEGLDTVVRELGPWVVNLHIKDIAIRRIDTKMGFHVEGRPAGEGLLDIPSLLLLLKQAGRLQSVTLELWPPREATLEATIRKEAEWVQRSCHYLAPLVKRVEQR
jgi:3-oxoisoapionate decarboxylase